MIRSGNQADYVDTGHLIYIDRGALWAIRFDLDSLVTICDAVALNERVLVLGAANFAISRSGTLAYLPERAGGSRSLVWVDRSGRQQPIPLPPGTYRNARLSPDGKRVALHVFDQSPSDLDVRPGDAQVDEAVVFLPRTASRGAGATRWPYGRATANA